MVKRRLFGFFYLLGAVVLLLGAAACEKVNDVLKSIGLSNTEIVEGLKEALNVAAGSAQGSASKVDGFLKNKAIEIMLPDQLKPVKQLVDKANDIPVVGSIVKSTLGDGVEELRVAMNHAAEHASRDVLPIFKGAVKEMTITRRAAGATRGRLGRIALPERENLHQAGGEVYPCGEGEHGENRGEQLLRNPLHQL